MLVFLNINMRNLENLEQVGVDGIRNIQARSIDIKSYRLLLGYAAI